MNKQRLEEYLKQQTDKGILTPKDADKFRKNYDDIDKIDHKDTNAVKKLWDKLSQDDIVPNN